MVGTSGLRCRRLSDDEKGLPVRAFRFTMNVLMMDPEDRAYEPERFSEASAAILDEFLRREVEGKFSRARVLGRRDKGQLKIILEFEAAGLNAAHAYGFAQTAEVFAAFGADVSDWYEQPHVAVTEDDGSDHWDVLVEELLRGARVTPSEASTETLAAA